MFDDEVLLFKRPQKPSPQFAVTWAFPGTYAIAMASLGYQLVWWLLEQSPLSVVRRAFSDLQEHRFDQSELVGFTLSWELSAIEILRMLTKLGVPCLSDQRRDDQPLIFGGGPVLTANPEPFAPFFDVILLGDAEILIPSFLKAWSRARLLPSRHLQLTELACVPGLYVPALYQVEYEHKGPITNIEPTAALAPGQLSKQAFMPPPDYVAHSVILSPTSSWGDRFLVEVARSCPQECRFCLASYLTRPFRAANTKALLSAIEFALTHTRKIGLLGPSVTEHPDFEEIAKWLLARQDIDISIASVRADTLTPLILKMLHALGQRSVTIAIESGSERLREIMKKNLTELEIRRAVALIEQQGLTGVKFYGIAGLPGEEQGDLDETVRLLTSLKKEHKRLRFVFGLSSFVPKAQTPFQWAGRDRASKQKIEYLRKHLARAGIEVRPESHNWSEIQTLLSRGDRRLAPVLLELANSPGNLGDWKKVLRQMPPCCPQSDFYVYRDIPHQEIVPWSHLVSGQKLSMLKRHSQMAKGLM